MSYKYTFKDAAGIETAKAVGLNLPISSKAAVEICNAVRGKPIEKAKALLERAIRMEQAIPFKKYKRDQAHKRGRVAAAKYPIKACEHILSIIKSAESNASDKGLLSDGLVLLSIVAHKASTPPRQGRHRGRKARRTHIEVVLKEEVGLAKEKPEPGRRDGDAKAQTEQKMQKPQGAQQAQGAGKKQEPENTEQPKAAAKQGAKQPAPLVKKAPAKVSKPKPKPAAKPGKAKPAKKSAEAEK
jgi:large subunit ribosomal protein L22